MDARTVEQIVRAIVERRCALFVGPDLGESAGSYRGLPNSWQLASELASACGYTGRLRSLPFIAQLFEKRRGREELQEYLINRLGSGEYKPLPAHELIARIPFSVIVNGGWDLLLDDALEAQQVPFRTVQLYSDLSGFDPDRRETLLYKPYGSVSNIKQLRITDDDQLTIFQDSVQVVNLVQSVIGSYTLVLIGYNLDQDAVFTRIYHDILRQQRNARPPAFAIYSQGRPEDGVWDALSISTIAVGDPSELLYELAGRVADAERRELYLPPLDQISRAPRLSSAEVAAQAAILNDLMGQIGVADLVERSEIPLLNDTQLRDIDSMRLAYERLTTSLAAPPGTGKVWLRQGNLEYARGNYTQAELYYLRAHKAEPKLAEVYHNMHFVRLALGDWERAMRFYFRAVALDPDLAIVPPHYRLSSILGSSELAVVYRADDKRTGRTVAVKVMHRGRANAERALALFEREAGALRLLKHPQIVELLEAQAYRGSYYIATAFIVGPSVRTVLNGRAQPLSLDRAYAITADAGAALGFAHSQQIVHRDVKPSNILLDTVEGERAVLIDFGLARPLPIADQTTLLLGGTLPYLAPEQAQGKPGDARTDLYGLASVLYELLTGRNPSQGTYRRPSDQRPELTGALDLVVERGRHFNPAERYPSVEAFLIDLDRAMAYQPSSTRAHAWTRTAERTNQALQLLLRRGWWAILLAAALLAVASQLLNLAWQIRGLAAVAAVGLLILLLVGAATQWYVSTQQARLRDFGPAALLARYGAVLGAIFGAASCALWLRSLAINADLTPLALGKHGLGEFAVYFVSVTIFSVVSTGLLFLLLRAGGLLAAMRGKPHAVGFLLAFTLCVILMLTLAVLLPVGWNGRIDLPGPQ